MKEENNYYSDIRMGSWGRPIHIGCYSYNWSLFAEEYRYDKPTEFGCETSGEKYWLTEVTPEYAVFEKTSNDNMMAAYSKGVGKTDSMELYKKVLNGERHMVIGKPKDGVYYNVGEMCFADFEMAKLHRAFLIRIPYNRFDTEETVKIIEIKHVPAAVVKTECVLTPTPYKPTILDDLERLKEII